MRISRLGLPALLLLLFGTTDTAAAQQRRYLIEIGAAAGITSFDEASLLGSGFGPVGRAAFWTPFGLSVEAEAGFSSPEARAGIPWSARQFSGSLLYNIGIGRSSTAFLRAGYGAVSYDSDSCTGTPPRSLFGACGSTGAIVGGLGARLGLSETIMLRVEGFGNHSSSSGITNFGATGGLALMLGSKPLEDTDGDGVYDIDDDCEGTPLGALVDSNGCPTDNDGDGVFDGLDRCPTTPEGARVNEAGCPLDEDADNVPDGVDACEGTPAGAAVDERGCPTDSDADGVADGLDRCPATPRGASVDQLGCPGDEDGDRVLDGLDRCPRTPAGSTVNAFGCPPGVSPGAAQRFTEDARIPLPGVAFPAGSARLPASAHASLDSLAAALVAQPGVQVEVAAHGDGRAAEGRNLTQLRAEAVRQYLIGKQVPVQQVTARGYGAAEPLAQGTSAAVRDRNRRVEIRVLSVARNP